MVKRSLDAAEAMSRLQVSVEVIDIRTMVPLDIDTVLASVRKTGRVLIAHEDALFAASGRNWRADRRVRLPGTGCAGAPVRGGEHPVPYNWHLEEVILPKPRADRACEELAGF